MSGKKGRSGKATTPEAHAAKVVAGRMGGNAKAGRSKTDEAKDNTRDAEFISDDDLIGLLPGKNPYDHVVLKTKGQFSYLDGKTREQVNGEVLANEKLTVAILQARGDLLTREQVEARDELMDEIYMTHLGRLVEFVGTVVPPEEGNAVRQKAEAWVSEARALIAVDIETIGK